MVINGYNQRTLVRVLQRGSGHGT